MADSGLLCRPIIVRRSEPSLMNCERLRLVRSEHWRVGPRPTIVQREQSFRCTYLAGTVGQARVLCHEVEMGDGFSWTHLERPLAILH